MNPHILITGAPGWLGNRFIEVLLNDKNPLLRQLNPASLRALTLPGMPIRSLQEKGIEIVEGNVADRASLAKATQGIDIVFHLAGIVHAKKPRDFIEINARGTQNLLESAIQSGCSRFVFISSNSAAGVQTSSQQLMTETTEDHPYLTYGKSKKMAEDWILEAQKQGRIEGVILRPCWYYGPGQPARQTRFFKMIQKGNPLVFGNGLNLRSMSYLDNVIDGLLLAAMTPKAAGQIYWIADGEPYPTLEIYKTVARLLGVKKFKPRHIPSLTSTLCRLADRIFQGGGFYQQEIHVAGEMTLNIGCSIEKAKRELGYQPQVSLEEGMRRSIEWCQQNGQL